MSRNRRKIAARDHLRVALEVLNIEACVKPDRSPHDNSMAMASAIGAARYRIGAALEELGDASALVEIADAAIARRSAPERPK